LNPQLGHSLGVVFREIVEDSFCFFTESYHPKGAKGFSIVSYYFLRTTKPRQDVLFQEFHDNEVSGIFGGDGLYPFSEVINSCKDPSMLATGREMYLSYEVKAPLLEGVVG